MRLTLIVAATLSAGAAYAATCESLASLKLADTTITLAQEVAAAGNTPAYCRVAATLKPSSDSNIKIEVWLPESGWNEKFVANGNGGWSGAITPNTLAAAVRRGASNRDIAADLFLSPKTVEFHLRQIYRKLDVRSRTQLVAMLAKQDTAS